MQLSENHSHDIDENAMGFRSNVICDDYKNCLSLTKHSFCSAPIILPVYRAEEGKHSHKRVVNHHVVHASPIYFTVCQLYTRYNTELTDQGVKYLS